MKKTKKLDINKVTLRDLDEPTLGVVAGGLTGGNSCVCPSRFNLCPTDHTICKCG